MEWSGESALSDSRKYEEALRNFDKAIELNPQSFDSYFNKANILLKLHKYEEAVKIFDQLLALDLDDKEAQAQRRMASRLFMMSD